MHMHMHIRMHMQMHMHMHMYTQTHTNTHKHTCISQSHPTPLARNKIFTHTQHLQAHAQMHKARTHTPS